MATQHLTWQQAFQLFAEHLVGFQTYRAAGMDVARAGAALGISAEAAEGYEDVCRQLKDLQCKAAPGATGAAPDPTKGIHS
jgi:hypothetical protein